MSRLIYLLFDEPRARGCQTGALPLKHTPHLSSNQVSVVFTFLACVVNLPEVQLCGSCVISFFLTVLCFLFQIGQVKQELSRKDTELLALQTKLETLTNQFSDSKQHIEVLKESLTAKEQRAAILQTEVKGFCDLCGIQPIPSFILLYISYVQSQVIIYCAEITILFLLLDLIKTGAITLHFLLLGFIPYLYFKLRFELFK